MESPQICSAVCSGNSLKYLCLGHVLAIQSPILHIIQLGDCVGKMTLWKTDELQNRKDTEHCQ